MKLGKEAQAARLATDAKARRELSSAIAEDRDYILLVADGKDIAFISVVGSHEAQALMLRAAVKHIATPKLVGIERPKGEPVQ